MNTAVRVAVRVGIDRGHTMLAVRNGFEGLGAGAFEEMHWMSVNGWVSRGGAELGTSRYVPDEAAYEAIAEQMQAHDIDGLLMIGGFSGYEAAYGLYARRDRFPVFARPIVCLPASINNDLPRSELSIGADTALNSIVADVDKIKQSAVAVKRSFVVEVMGRDCGYLALMSGLATGAERVYLPETGSAWSFAARERTRPIHRASSARSSSVREAASSTCARRSWVMSNKAATRHPSIGSRPPGWRRSWLTAQSSE